MAGGGASGEAHSDLINFGDVIVLYDDEALAPAVAPRALPTLWRPERMLNPLSRVQIDALLASDGLIEDRCVARRLTSTNSGDVEDALFRVTGKELYVAQRKYLKAKKKQAQQRQSVALAEGKAKKRDAVGDDPDYALKRLAQARCPPPPCSPRPLGCARAWHSFARAHCRHPSQTTGGADGAVKQPLHDVAPARASRELRAGGAAAARQERTVPDSVLQGGGGPREQLPEGGAPPAWQPGVLVDPPPTVQARHHAGLRPLR
jgi:hypothetical protein